MKFVDQYIMPCVIVQKTSSKVPASSGILEQLCNYALNLLERRFMLDVHKVGGKKHCQTFFHFLFPTQDNLDKTYCCKFSFPLYTVKSSINKSSTTLHKNLNTSTQLI